MPLIHNKFSLSSYLFDYVSFSSFVFQELSMCSQPVLLGLCIKEALTYHFCPPRRRHLDICYL